MSGLRFFTVKAVPYILTFLAGAGVFFISIHKPTAWSAWLVEIAGALSAIPIVFLIYDYSNYRLGAKADKTMYDGLTFDINSVVLKMLRFFHDALGMREPISRDLIERMLMKTLSNIKKELKIGRKDIEILKSFKYRLDDFVYKSSSAKVFDSAEFEAMAAMPRELSHLINELEFRGYRDELARSVENLFALVSNWFDLCEEEALKSHSHFQLMEAAAKTS